MSPLRDFPVTRAIALCTATTLAMLTVGVMPALAEPSSEPVAPTTPVVVPETAAPAEPPAASEPAPPSTAPEPAIDAPPPPSTAPSTTAEPTQPVPDTPNRGPERTEPQTPTPTVDQETPTTVPPGTPTSVNPRQSDAPTTTPESVPPSSTGESTQAPDRNTDPETTADDSASVELPPSVPTERPRTMDAPQQDVAAALTADVVEQEPAPASTQDVAAVADEIAPLRDERAFGGGNDANRTARQWDPQWVQYDDYYRPVIANPYRQPVKIVYVYENTPRVAVINPLQRIVLNVARYAAYSFTAVVSGAVNTAVNAAVGSFFGGGYYPGYGMAPPPPPPPLLRYDNVPVQVRYSHAAYEPFRVNRVVDAGFDEQYGQQRVLLDGVTPAWGDWTQSSSGDRMFEVRKTQQFPGLDEPGEGPLPGQYQLRLASDEQPTESGGGTTVLVVAGLAVAALAAVGGSVLIGRRRSADDSDAPTQYLR